MKTFNPESLKTFTKEIFEQLGIREDDAHVAADIIIRANLEGIDSHGISRLPIYSKRLKEKRINPVPHITFNQKTDAILMVDGDNGLGQIVSYKAICEGMKIVKDSGIVAIGIKNSNHFGTASYYCQLACNKQLAAIALTNSPPGIPPWGGKTPFFGTNPIAFGFPTENNNHVIIDLSTSVVARGKIILANKLGQTIPKGWAIDRNGNPTTNPAEALGGAILPFGGVKGFAIALAVEIFTGILSEATISPNVNNIYDDQNKEPANVGHFFILMDIEKFIPYDNYLSSIHHLLNEMKNVPTLPSSTDKIRYPGERRKSEYEARLSRGVELPDKLINELAELGHSLNVSFPSTLK